MNIAAAAAAASSNAKVSQKNNINNTKPRLTSILGSFLEAAIHELLYLRSLYPHDAFSPSRHLQIAVNACRHPAVVDYIYDTLKVAVPSIINGEIDALYLIFLDESTCELYERYSFEFDSDVMSDSNNVGTTGGNAKVSSSLNNMPQQDVGYIIQELERSLRDVLLSIMSLEGSDLGRRRGMTTFPDTTTFKICLHTKKSDDEQRATSIAVTSQFDNINDGFGPELKEAIESGKWRKSDSKSYHLHPDVNDRMMDDVNRNDDNDNNDNTSQSCISRPLKSFNAPLCGLRMQLVMDFKN